MVVSAASHGPSDLDGTGEAAGVIAAYTPRLTSERSACFAREVVARAAPATAARAKALLFAASKLAGFGERVGLELEAGVLLDPAVIERFVLTGTSGVSPATRRTLRTNLRSLARALERYPQPPPTSLPRERAKQPYSDAEIAGYLRLAAAQRSDARRVRASALICLGAGAGIVQGELRYVRGSDVVARSGGLVVILAGRRARTVPVLARFHEPLSAAACFAGEELICGGRDPARRNLTDALAAVLSRDRSLPRLHSGRLRSTWLVQCARAIGLGAFMHAAGITCSQRLGDLAAQLPDLTEPELVALLAGDGR